MPKYIFAYHGGATPQTEQEKAEGMQAWMTWLSEMKDACIDMGAPVGLSKTVGSGGVEDNGGANPLSGYSIIEASDVTEACDMAKRCPILAHDGATVEVAPLAEL